MKIGIISDSHDHHVNILKAVKIFNEDKVEYILHAGDIISPIAAAAFSNVRDSQFISVFGNCDGDKSALSQVIEEFGGQIHNQPYTGEMEGKKIFMTHIPVTLTTIIDSGKYDIVIYGHTHKQDIRKVGVSLVINPGELTDWVTGKSSLVLLQLDDMSYEVKSVS